MATSHPATTIPDPAPSSEHPLVPPQQEENETVPQQPEPQVDIEPDINLGPENDTDSSYGDAGTQSTTYSATSSIFEYKYENGRRYHAYRAGQYLQPNDEQEQERLDMVHHWYRLCLGGALFRAPIDKNPQKVLDIGTGTGIWAIEFGDEYPSAEVIGTDLSAIQPTWVPPNVTFIVDDAELEWTWPENTFDFIHARTLGGSIQDFDRLIRQAYFCLKPGGWLEFDEFESWLKSDDGTLRPDGAISEWQTLVDQASSKFGKRLNIAETLKPKMDAGGFVSVTDDVYKNPVNPWPKERRLKEIGMWGNLAMVEGIEAISIALFTRVLGWGRAEVEVLLARVRTELKDRKIHSYSATHFVYGRKPMAPSQTHGDDD